MYDSFCDFLGLQREQHFRNRKALMDAVEIGKLKQRHLPLKQIVRECVAEMVDSEAKPDGQED
jgi:hypothetical protein